MTIIDIKTLKKQDDTPSADDILEEAKSRFDKVIIVGFTDKAQLPTVDTNMNNAEAIFCLEAAKHQFFNDCFVEYMDD